MSAESTAPTRNTANVSRQAGAWGGTGRGRGHQPLADVSQSETSSDSDSDSDTVTDLEASGSDKSDTPDDTGHVQLPSSSSRHVSMSQQLQRRPHPMAVPASMWDHSTVWAGNIAIVRRTDTAVGARVLA